MLVRRKNLFVLMLALVTLAGCQAPTSTTTPAPSNGVPPTGQAQQNPVTSSGQRPANPTAQAPQISKPVRAGAPAPDLQATAQLLDVRVAAWQEPQQPAGSIATLTVVNPEGKPEPLTIETLEVTVRLEGRLARTEVKQVFRNHLDRQTEGSYELQLPDGAAISRLAMDVDGKMVEGELVERERARLIYESIVRQQKDPALLEWQGGDRFKTQIFPIPAKGTKTVILAYETMLPESRDGFSYVYALPNLQGQPGGSAIGTFSLAMDVKTLKPFNVGGYDAKTESLPEGGTRVSLTQKDFVPTGALEVFFPSQANADGNTLYAKREVMGEQQQFFMIDYQPQIPGLSGDARRNIVVAIDTSSGLGQGVIDQSKVAAMMLFDTMAEGAQFQLVHGDFRAHTCAPQAFGKADREKLVACLKPLNAGGATDLGGLLRAAATATQTMPGATSLVLFSDGIASLGELDMGLIQARTTAALGADVALHAVAVGHDAATADLTKLSHALRGHTLRMTPSEQPDHLITKLLEQVSEPLMTDIKAEVLSGEVEYLSPSAPTNLARGEALTVLGRLKTNDARIKVSGRFMGQEVSKEFTLTAPQTQPESQLVSHFWARAAIDDMETQGQHRGNISAMSLKYGVMSKYTSFLVLENDEAFKRFEVERRKEAERQRLAAASAAEGLKMTEGGADGQSTDGEKDKGGVKNLQKGEQNLQDVLAAPKPIAPASPARTEARAEEAAPPDMVADMPSFDAKEDAFEGDGKAREKSKDSKKRDLADNKPSPSPRPDPAKSASGKQSGAEFGTLGGDDFAAGGPSSAPGNGGLGGTTDKTNASPPADTSTTTPKKPQEPQSLSEMIAALEPTRDTLQPYEAGRLIALYVEAKKLDKAREYLTARLTAYRAQNLPVPEIAQLFRDYRVRTNFPDAFASLNMDVLRAAQGAVGPEVINNIFQGRVAAQQWDALVDDLSAYPLSTAVCTQLIEKLLNSSQPDTARRLFERAGKHHDAVGKLRIISVNSLRGLFADERFALASQLLTDQPGQAEALATVIELGAGRADRADAAFNHLETACLKTPLAMDQCRAHLAAFSAHPRAAALTEKLIDNRLANMRQIRSLDISNPALIREFSTLLRERSRNEEADRLLSELVEFAPHDYATRIQYAREFETLKRPVDACDTYASAIQLDASQRDTFRTMMGLRRAFPAEAPKLRECVVQGVSNLPVTRDVSIVLTWEDPSVDVDMHITEAGGEHVDYTHRESKQGGLLYYDITDGFGPEIYVLGHGAKGAYNLEVVYFRGQTQNVKGTLTLIRNAGAASETRENFDFTLPVADSNKRIPLTTLTL